MFPGLTQGLRRAAQLKANEVAVSDQHRCCTWQHLIERISRLAGGFRELGLQQNDRVAYLAYNDHRSLEVFYAALWAGGIIAPLNTRLNADDLNALLEIIEPRLIVAAPEFGELAKELDVPVAVPISQGQALGAGHYEAIIRATAPIADDRRCGDDVACLFFTGGTTGSPKAVMLTHDNIMANTVNFISHTGIDEDTTHLHCGPLYHVAAAVRLFSVTQAAGRHVMLPSFDADQVIKAIDSEQVTLATVVPTMLQAIVERIEENNSAMDSLRMMTYGAAPMPAALLRRAMDKLPQVAFVQSYGMTESAPIATLLGAKEHMDGDGGKLRSAGRAALLTEVAIVDENGQALPPLRTGEIVVKGPNVMLGYWRNPEATQAAIKDGWMRTGDAGYLDEEGYLFVVDRLKDMIISGGENIHSQEIENVIAAMPGVRDCAVIGIPDHKWGERVHAVVVPDKGEAAITETGIIDHCRRHLASYKCPKSVTLRQQPLPLSAANKILKPQLKKEIIEETGRDRRR